MIEVKKIHRTFRSPIKSAGFRGVYDLLFQRKYKTHEALKGVSFTLEPGSFNGLIGENGAGKTTLLKILSGLIPPTLGEARVMGFQPFQRTIEFRKSISLVMGQKAQLWWDLPAMDAFDLIQAIYSIPKKIYRERLHTLTQLLNVKEHLQTQIRRLSLGERMKMELIGALIHWPRVIFLDEPTIGLDVVAAHQLREFLKEFNQQEKATILLTSHNMDDIERLCNRVLILKSGELIYDGSPEHLTRSNSDEEKQTLKIRILDRIPLSELAMRTGLPLNCFEQIAEDQKIHIQTDSKQIISVIQSLLSHFQVADIGIEPPSLEKIIQKLYLS